jgi:YD repeat-containing protein
MFDKDATHEELVWNEDHQMLSRTLNGAIKAYRYDPLGRLNAIVTGERISTWEYLSSCRQPTFERVSLRDATSQQLTSQVLISVRYDKASCRPTLAYSSDGSSLIFSYENRDRYVKVVDDNNRVIHLQYDSDVRSPSVITIDGVGTGSVIYDGNDSSRITSEASETAALQNALSLLRDLLPDPKFDRN